MKKVICSAIFAGAMMFTASAGNNNIGAGLGTVIFEGHDGLVSQTLAATTNGICMNQLFAITSGTLGAEKPDSLWATNEMNKIIKGNMDKVAKDIATGKGETIDTLAAILKIEDKDAFSALLQANFDKIYTSEAITHEQVVANIMKVVNS